MTTRQIKWTNSKGQSVTATVEIVTERQVSSNPADGTRDCCEWSELVEIGDCVMGYDIQRIEQRQVGTITVAGRSGNVGIPSDAMDAIDAARAELRALPVWVEHEALIERNRREVGEYEEHVARVNNMMTCDGKTY